MMKLMSQLEPMLIDHMDKTTIQIWEKERPECWKKEMIERKNGAANVVSRPIVRALCGLQANSQSVLLLLGCNVDVIAAQMVPGSSVVRRRFPDERGVLGGSEATLFRFVMASGAALSTFFSGSDPRFGLEVASSEVTRLFGLGYSSACSRNREGLS